jgi:hypothetical protein
MGFPLEKDLEMFIQGPWSAQADSHALGTPCVAHQHGPAATAGCGDRVIPF